MQDGVGSATAALPYSFADAVRRMLRPTNRTGLQIHVPRTRTRLLRLHRLLEPRRRDRGGRDSEHAPGEPALAQVFRDAVRDRGHLELGAGDLFQELVRIDALALRPELAE
jgi:hypothetical protein